MPTHKRNRVRVLLAQVLAALVLAVIPRIAGAQALTIVSPTSGQEVRAGQQLQVVVANPTGSDLLDVSLQWEGEARLAASESQPPYVFDNVRIPNTRRGPIRLAAIGRSPDDSVVAVGVVQLTVVSGAPLTSLSILPPTATLTRREWPLQLFVFGTNPDGTQVDLSDPTTGTTYRTASGGTGVLSVASDGTVIAHANGSETVLVSNGGLVAEIQVKVAVTNLPPEIAVLAPIAVDAGSVRNLDVFATDPDGDELRFMAGYVPSFVTMQDLGGGHAQLRIAPPADNVAGDVSGVIGVADTGLPTMGTQRQFTIAVRRGPSPTPSVAPSATPTPTAQPTPSPVGTQGLRPAADCLTAKLSTTTIKNRTTRKGETADTWTWTWSKGDAFGYESLGDPIGGMTTYYLSVWQTHGAHASQVIAASIPTGLTCGKKLEPCWKRIGKKTPRGLNYNDAGGRIGGIKTLKVQAGAVGKSSLKIVAGGQIFSAPALPLHQEPEVVIQLTNSSGTCWQTRFQAPAGQNDDAQFSDTIPEKTQR